MNKQRLQLLNLAVSTCSLAIAGKHLILAEIQHKNLQDSPNNLAKINNNLNLSQEERIETLSLKLKETENQINSLKEKLLLSHEANSNSYGNSRILESMHQNTEGKGKIAETIIKEAKEFKSNIKHNDISGFIQDYIDSYNEFLSTLSFEQLICLVNIIMLWIILSTMSGLIINYYGNAIINRLNIELRFPKLAKIILLRNKFSQKIIKLQIVYLYLVVLISLGINIYIFF